jgi:hypothetical protein
MIILVFSGVFAFVCLVGCWLVGEQSLTTKVVFTVLYLASLGLLLLRGQDHLFVVAQCFHVVVIGGSTFGANWLMRRH